MGGLRFAVVGAGSVGCFFGGMLARAGMSVVLIGRASHVNAMREQGLRLETQMFDDRVRVEASTDPSAVAGADVVLFCVKSIDSVATAREIGPFLDPHAVVLSLQNGVENAELLRQVLPQQVIASVVYVATEMAGPGHLKHHGRGELVIAESPASAGIVAAFARAGIPVQVSGNVMGALWSKLIVNCAYNALSAIVQQPYGRLVAVSGVPDLMQAIVDECLQVAAADGITLPSDPHEDVHRIAETMAGQYSSTAQDVARGKPNEIDFLNGYVLRRGQANGVPTPINQTLWTLVKLSEKK